MVRSGQVQAAATSFISLKISGKLQQVLAIKVKMLLFHKKVKAKIRPEKKPIAVPPPASAGQ